MAIRSEAQRWGLGARTLHWLMALLIIGLGLVGLYMTDLPNSAQKVRIYALHKSVGLTVLALLLLRLAWRLADRRPDELPMPHWQALAARAVHVLLYLLMLVLPLSGWLYNSASGYALQWFGLFNLPAIVERSHDLHEIAEEAHELMFWLLALMVAAHAGAAFYHHLFQQDATLARMLPRGWLKAPGAPAAVGADATEAAPAASSPQTPNE